MNPVKMKRKVLLERQNSSWPDARVALMGIPMDNTSSYRPGSRFAPEEIRKVFESLEDYSLAQNRSFNEVRLYDVGEVELPQGNVERQLSVSREAVNGLVKEGKKPFLLGGEHTITLAGVTPLLEKYPDLVVLQLDAHADLRSSYQGERYSHASSMYALLELGVDKLYQLGIRSGISEEISLARNRTHFYPYRVKEPLREIVPALKGKPVYVTLDIDVLDPAFAPGTGTPEPGGISSDELLTSLLMLTGMNLVGFDLVEVSPPYDSGSITAIVAAKILREAALLLDPLEIK